MRDLPSGSDVHEWFENGHKYGIALICGRVSGNMEMLELEGRAMDSDSISKLMSAFDRHGVSPIWTLLNGPEGYSECSPSGGLHLLYRILDHDVPGNERIARRYATQDELETKPTDRFKVLAETRGEGGYVIAAPTPGYCHPSGKSWLLIAGEYGQLPVISWDQRCRLHAAIHDALNEVEDRLPSTLPAPVSPRGLEVAGAGLSPGDDFERRVDWADDLLLGGAGWTLESRHGGVRNWTRPGKDRRDGGSATTGRDPARDRLYVFSSSTVFTPEVPYTKFGAFALLHHNGDHSAAARALVQMGFGDQLAPTNPDDYIIAPEHRGKDDGTPDPLHAGENAGSGVPSLSYTLDEIGNAQRLWNRVRGRYHYVWEEKATYEFDGRRWREDYSGSLTREMIKVTDEMLAEARATDAQKLYRHASKSRSAAALKAACTLMQSSIPGVTVRREEFDRERHLLNVGNGVLDLHTRELRPHDPTYLMTRLFGADYRPEATCPRFERFMADALPDEAMRSYVQRALGYTLLGDADQRSMFLIYGPSGTGKSTLMETVREVFGDYGTTAAAGAFRARHGDGTSPTNDLHGLRGRRFVTTSETAQETSFDEDTLKRITGRDRVVSRELYQRNQEWTPECVLWLATNHPPKFSPDDDAIWRRAKLVPFETVFRGQDVEIKDMARSVLIPEADGILNWLLAGLAAYLEHGLGEPVSVEEAATEHRTQADSVVQFLEDQIGEGVLVAGDEQQIRTRDLYAMYVEWCRAIAQLKPIGSRRFILRIESNASRIKYRRIGGQSVWSGVGRAPNASVLGTFMT